MGYRVFGWLAQVLAQAAVNRQYVQPTTPYTNIVIGRNPLAFGVTDPSVAISAPGSLAYVGAGALLSAAQIAVAGQSVKLNNSAKLSATATTDLVLAADPTRPTAGTASIIITQAAGFLISIVDSALNYLPGQVSIAVGKLNSSTTSDTFTMQYYFIVQARRSPATFLAFFINNNGGNASVVGQTIKRINASGAGAVVDSTPAILVTNSSSTNAIGASTVNPGVTSIMIESFNSADINVGDSGPQAMPVPPRQDATFDAIYDVTDQTANPMARSFRDEVGGRFRNNLARSMRDEYSYN